ncbi:MAG: DNA-packaging protein [Donghicola eburneus]|jgi:hypothetical protein|nr:terminase small subunit [Donghicola eburneus]MCI5040035.1 DNA-packaging protein [Donghicola eburneus]
MAAPKGNRFWEARSSHGANPKFKHATDLWDACLEYFAWVEDNPLQEAKLAQNKGEPKVVSMNKMRAMTIGGMCVFLDISEATWYEWRKKRKDLSEVITRVEQVIRTQKFEGAAADLLNPSIIARDLGLSDRKELTGTDGGPIKTEEVGAAGAKLAAYLDAIAERSGTAGESDAG